MKALQIKQTLLGLKDEKYYQFIIKLIPDNKYEVIGIRTPILKKLAKNLVKENSYLDYINDFNNYHYYEEYLLNVFILNNIKDYEKLKLYLKQIVKYLNSWALVDSFSNDIINKNLDDFSFVVNDFLNNSDNIYIKRLAIDIIMKYYLLEEYLIKYLDIVLKIKTNEYYLKMSISWFLQTSFVKQFDLTYDYFKKHFINDKDIKKYTIRKIKDSFAISKQSKEKVLLLLNYDGISKKIVDI